MPFWNTDRIRQECQAQGLITPYREDRVIRCAYELGVGPEAFITSKSDDTTHLPAGNKVTIPPGQFGLLITREVVYVPDTAIAFISIRARIKFQGLVNVSGFHVDPGFRGQLKFAVYNAGSKDIVLDQDERVFMIWFADLDAASPDPYGAVPASASVISSEDVSKLKGEVASPAELKKQMEDMKTELDKKIHAVEQTKLFNRSIMFAILTAVLMIFFTSFVKPYFDGTKAAPPATTQPAGAPAPVVATPAITLPDHLGFYILGAGGIAGLCSIVAAFIVRKWQQ
jgi:dCTP deaminase